MLRIDIGLKICRNCHRELPIDDFYVNYNSKDGHRNVCKHCYIERNIQKRKNNPLHQVHHRTEMHESAEEQHRQRKREYMRNYREANKERIREIARESAARARAGSPKRTPGPPHGTKFVKQNLPKGERLCESCKNWPCFEGIENLETDFAREGCQAFCRRGEVS